MNRIHRFMYSFIFDVKYRLYMAVNSCYTTLYKQCSIEVMDLNIDFNSIKPIYIQIAEAMENEIITGRLPEGGPAYSQLTLAKELGINPATAAKGINVLVQKGILEKQRGASMAVAVGSREKLMSDRRENDFHSYVVNLVEEAKKIELPEEKLMDMVRECYRECEGGEDNG